MKRGMVLFIVLPILLSVMVRAQSFIDPGKTVEAKVFAYKMASAPSIDAAETEWENIPWTESRYNDRDFNSDQLIDPQSARSDYRARWKAAWVNGLNKIFFLIETHDDIIYTVDSVRATHRDNVAIRLDPFDEEIAGEPFEDPAKNSYSIIFQIDNGESYSYEGNEGVKPVYVTKTSVDKSQSPVRTVMEIEITLPSNLSLTEGYVMGYFPLFDDNDPEDDSYNNKNTVMMQWPQMYCDLGKAEDKNASGRLLPDVFWINDFYWGNLECIDPSITEVAAGASIQSAIDAAAEGDIIKLAAGTYTENIVINKPYIQLIGTMTDTDTTKLMPADATVPVIKVADDDAAPGVVIKSIGFYGWPAVIDTESVRAEEGIEFGSAQLEVIGNYFYGFQYPVRKSGVDSSKAHACVFEDNTVYDCTAGIICNTPFTAMRYNTVLENRGGYGLESKGLLAESPVDIAYNTVFNHHGECGIGYGGSGVFTIHHNMLVRSETLYGAGDQTGDDGIENQDEGGSTDYIYNNTIVGWKSDGMQLGASSKGTSNFHIFNNLIANCGGKDYDIRTTGSHEIDYGLSYNNKGGNLITTLGTNGIEADPLFTAEFEDDFTITETSPAVNKALKEPFGFKVLYYDEGLDIGAFETGGVVVSVNDDNYSAPAAYKLDQNYPNPFNPSTVISFTLPQRDRVTLKVYNVIGQLVSVLADEVFESGAYQVKFNAAGLASGMYFYSLEAGDFSLTKKMVLIK